MHFHRRRRVALVMTLALGLLGMAGAASPLQAASTNFTLVRSSTTATAGCIAGAAANVSVRDVRGVQVMRIAARNLPRNTTFVVWINQQPNAPFGVSWYLGDMTTNQYGAAAETFIGRFNIETFAVAPGALQAPVTHPGGTFPDARRNPTFAPVHLYHVGLWFDSTADAAAAGCPNAQTPFNGDHTAGVQALSTRNYPVLRGPLSRLPA